MLKPQNRIRKDRDFKKIFRFSKPENAGNIQIRQIKNNSKETRFGFIISNKIEKRATKRNSLKRRFRAIIRELMPKMQSGFDAIIIVKKNYDYPYNYNQIKEDVVCALEKSKILL